MAAQSEITPEMLRQALAYNPNTGVLNWKYREMPHLSECQRSAWNRKFAGRQAFTRVDRDGYFKGVVFNRPFLAHRVAWAIYHGQWPIYVLDHINGDPGDNRICNLRDVSRSANQKNMKLPIDNTSGAVGVQFVPRLNKWRARIGTASGEIHIGVFADKSMAIEARQKIAMQHGFTERHGTSPKN